jgi:transposase InsO family protein
MYEAITRLYYIPQIRRWLSKKLNNCMVCKETRVDPQAPPISAIVPPNPMMVWQGDYIGAFPADVRTADQYGLVIIDCFSKKLFVYTTERQSDKHYMESMEDAFIRAGGKPVRIHTDNGGPFVSHGK